MYVCMYVCFLLYKCMYTYMCMCLRACVSEWNSSEGRPGIDCDSCYWDCPLRELISNIFIFEMDE